MGLLRSEGQKINRRLIVPSSLHRTYGAHHLHFITCSLSPRSRVDDEEARRKVEVYASQSDEPRTCQFARAMALEQLPVSIFWTKPARCGSMKAGEDFFSSSCRVIQQWCADVHGSRPSQTTRRTGHPLVGDANEIKGRATPPKISFNGPPAANGGPASRQVGDFECAILLLMCNVLAARVRRTVVEGDN
jgi:hypothetical protein